LPLRAVAGTGAVLALARCTVFNPLDHLQEGVGREDAASAPTMDGATPDQGPGCPPAQWSACGATVVVDSGMPGTIAADPVNDRVFYGDFATGDVIEMRCPDASCTITATLATGETTPLRVDFGWRWVYWTTPTEVRRLDLLGYDGGAKAATVASAADPRALSADTFFVVWSDSAGIHMWNHNAQQEFAGPPEPARVLLSRYPDLFFVVGGELRRCLYDTHAPARPCISPPVGILDVGEGGLLARADGFRAGDAGGLVATRTGPDATEIVLAEQRDAGAFPVLARAATIQALGAYDREIYFTTKSGELVRRSRDRLAAETILRGLGPRTAVVVLARQAFVADPDRHVVLRVQN
jgi:hypothetical protein